MSTTPVLIPVEEYLRTVYRPDCDYVDGEVQERNMGESPHAQLQTFFIRFFAPFEDQWDFDTVPEQRVQVGPRRFRIPDLALVRFSRTDSRIVRTPPILCIEILSSEDRMAKVQQRLDDYASMGVRSMWVIDPWRGTAFFAGADAILHETRDRLTVAGTGISITVAEIFAELDRLEKRAAARSTSAE
jgi:Uma2 family endonuclease